MSGGVIQELIPFRVELVPFEDLEINWDRLDTETIQGEFLQRIAQSNAVRRRFHELKDKMTFPGKELKIAFGESYTRFMDGFPPGEWTVLGKIGLFYLAAQPMRVAKLIPMDCCRFLEIVR